MALRSFLTRIGWLRNEVRDETASRDAPGTQQNLYLPTNTKAASRAGMRLLVVGLGGFVLWAVLAPLDEGVPSAGVVTVDTKRKSVQHPTGGIVRQILVREGQSVEEGALLLSLDDSLAKSNFEAVRQRYVGLRAMEGRLLAEQSGAREISFHPDLLSKKDDPLVRNQLQTQAHLFRTRATALQSDLNVLEESARGQEAALGGAENMLKDRGRQVGFVREELAETREMVKEGYAPRNRQLELERMVSELGAVISELQANSIRAQRAISELKLKMVQRRQDYQKEVVTQLADVRREVQAEAEKLKAVTEELERTRILAPASGQVIGLNIHTVAGVIQAGQKLMDIVPKGEALLLEARVAPHLIDRVHVGLATDIQFAGFAHSPQLVVDGKVVSVSTDLLSDPQPVPGELPAYYLARIQVTEQGMKQLSGRQMQAGMPAQVVIKTGERSVLTYLLHPLMKRLHAAMKEE